MEIDPKYAFLSPWFQDLREHVLPRDASIPDAPFYLQFRCWSADDFTASEAVHCVEFPANGDHTKLQRMREAIELFHALAAVSSDAFMDFFGGFIMQDGAFLFEGRGQRLQPIWECYLQGKISPGDVVATKPKVTWGELLGCPDDPWQYSEEFRQAMNKLRVSEEMEAERSFEWTSTHEAISMSGCQVSQEGEPELVPFVRAFGELLKMEAPSPVHMAAVRDGAALAQIWERNPRELADEGREMYGGTWRCKFAAPTFLHMPAAIAQAGLPSLMIRLDERDIRQQLGLGMTNAGHLFSTIACGESLCELPGVESGVSLVRRGKHSELEVQCDWASERMIGAMSSAISEAKGIKKLVFSLDEEEPASEGIDAAQWGWLAYALFTRTSNSSVESLRISNFPFTRRGIQAVKDVLKHDYPSTSRSLAGDSEYGFVNVKKGKMLRSSGFEGVDCSFVLSRDCYCRARVDHTRSRSAEVVVPGYGICTMELTADDQFDRDLPASCGGNVCRVRSLDLEISGVETDSMIVDLLSLVGTNLLQLSIASWVVEEAAIDLSEVATAAPSLKHLDTSSFNVGISSLEKLRDWGVQHLEITGSNQVNGLVDCLSDPACRMSRQLEEIKVSYHHHGRFDAAYVEALKAHNGEYISVVGEKFPIRSKVALLSVMRGDRRLAPESMSFHRVDRNMLSLIFAFAAIPKRRVIRVE